MAEIIDGRKISSQIKKNIKTRVEKMKKKPGLAVVLVGQNPASIIYVRAKERACKEVGIYSQKITLPKNVEQDKLLAVIKKLNNDNKINGILVQFPLPKGLSEKEVINTINPKKDVDLFHPQNIGRFYMRKKVDNIDKILAPCTPKGIIKLIESTGIKIEGKQAVVIGRSNLVGKPVFALLTAKNATVTLTHSRTKNLKEHTRKADILVAAVGRPKMIKADMVKKGAVVIDVGINRTDSGLVGDVDFEKVKNIAGHITPVPGGVGPMTIASLLQNTLLLSKLLNSE